MPKLADKRYFDTDTSTEFDASGDPGRWAASLQAAKPRREPNRNRCRSPWQYTSLLWAAGLAAAAFYLDLIVGHTASPILLYLLAQLLVTSRNGRETGLVGISAIAALLTIAAFVVNARTAANWAGVVRLSEELIALAVAGLLLSRIAAARQACEWRYESIFTRSRFPILEVDFSPALPFLDNLKARGVVDVVQFSRETPGFLSNLKENVRLLDMNDAMFVHFGMKPGVDLIPRTIASVAVDDDCLLELLQVMWTGKEYYDGGGRITRVDGKKVDVILGASINLKGAGAGSVIVTLVDVSAREAANNALMAANAELARATRVASVGTVSAAIAHELNQPIGAILLNAQTCLRYLRREVPDVGAALSAAERVIREGDRAADIVRETKELVAGRRRRPAPLGVIGLIEDVLELLAQDIADVGAELLVNKPTTEVWILGDRVALQQALANLVLNAVHALREQGIGQRRLIVALAHSEGCATIKVRDTGLGISEQIFNRIFDSFFTTKEEGTGMGLMISKSVIEAHDGTLRARNCEGGGAEFGCTLPLWIRAVDETPQSATPERSEANGRGVDADPTMQQPSPGKLQPLGSRREHQEAGRQAMTVGPFRSGSDEHADRNQPGGRRDEW